MVYLGSIRSKFVPYGHAFSIQFRHIAQSLESSRKGPRKGFSHMRAVDQNTHLCIEAHGAWVEIERTDEYPLLVNRKGLGVQTGARGSRQTSYTRFPLGRIFGLELIKFDTGTQEASSILHVGAMDQNDVGGRLRIRKYPHADAHPHQLFQCLREPLARHEVSRNEIHRAGWLCQ